MTNLRSSGILLASLALAVVAIRWADGEFQRIEPPSDGVSHDARPAWVGAMNRPYRRFQNAWIWACGPATLGMAALVALDGRRRRPLPAGSILVIIAFLVGSLAAAHFLLAAPPLFKRQGICYGLRDALRFPVPGAILGAWAVTWGRKIDWRGRLIAWMWMAEAGMLIAYGVLFG